LFQACTTTLNIAEIYQLVGKTKEMIETYESAKAYAKKVGKVKLTLRVLRNMHKSLMDTGKFDLAGTPQI
jgi:signal recognition particle GTPase